jgi:hypothetical protein
MILLIMSDARTSLDRDDMRFILTVSQRRGRRISRPFPLQRHAFMPQKMLN